MKKPLDSLTPMSFRYDKLADLNKKTSVVVVVHKGLGSASPLYTRLILWRDHKDYS